jgi:glyceraldehyde 3-phosphate dehydrogenase
MPLAVGINGAGRIGRALIRHLYSDNRVRVVAVNDLAETQNLVHLLRHDSIHGPFPAPVSSRSDDQLQIAERTLAYSRAAEPEQIEWQRHGVDVVVEATGRFVTREAAARHLKGGVRRVLVSAVCKQADASVVLGIQTAALAPEARVVSAASCTTHAAALPLALIERWYGVEAADVTTVHCTTGSQVTIDSPHPDPRRGRSALVSMIPTTTTASWGLAAALPALAQRLSCLAIRVPTPAVSLVQIVVQTTRPLDTLDEIRTNLRSVAETEYRGLLAVCDQPLVSIDFKSDPHSATIDLELTERPGPHLLRLFAWYDNEWGYSNRLADLLRLWEGLER